MLLYLLHNATNFHDTTLHHNSMLSLIVTRDQATTDSNQILYNDKTLPNTLCEFKRAHNKSKMADGSHLEKK